MSETLLQKIGRMEKEILLLKNKPVIKQAKQVKQVDYSVDIKRLAIDINKISDAVKSLELKVINQSVAIKLMGDLINKLGCKNNINALSLAVKSIESNVNNLRVNAPVALVPKKQKEIDVDSSVKKIVNIDYITNLYRNK